VPTAQASAAQPKPVKVLFDHDGGVDDFVALLALLASPKVDVVGVTVLPADCIGEVAFNTTLKILHFTGQTNIPVGLSTLTGQHEFPMQYRVEPLAVDMLPMLNGPAVADAVLQAKKVNTVLGQELFARVLLEQQEPIQVVITGEVYLIACRNNTLPGCQSQLAKHGRFCCHSNRRQGLPTGCHHAHTEGFI
jgi:purine nucleosidase